MLDAVKSGLDAVSNALGGAAPGAPGGPAPMTFTQGETVGETAEEAPGFQSPNEVRPRDSGAPIEFIHLGYAHPDTSLHFDHPALKDDTNLEFTPAVKSHGLMFRAGLEREALLLASFLTATQSVLADLEKTKGGAGELLAMGADLLGGSGGSAAPKAADVNAFGEAIKTAIAPVNAGLITYQNIHQAGLDLHQARANYRAFLEKLLAPPASDPAAGLLGGLSSSISFLPGLPPAVREVFNFMQGLALKPMDVYLGFYVRLAKDLEPVIEKAVRQYTVKAIQEQHSPVFYLWYPKPASPPAPATGEAAEGTGIGFLDDARQRFEQIRSTVENTVDAVTDFLSASPPPEPPPGAPYLDQALQIETPPPTAGAPPAPPKEVTATIVNGFNAALGLSGMPAFIERIISEVTLRNNEFLREVYRKLMERPAVEPIDEAAMYRAARTRLLDQLVALVMENVSLLQRAKEFSFNVQGKTIAPGAAPLEAAQKELNDQVLRHINVALELTMGELVDKLEGARQQAVRENAIAMEVYLGLFPWLLALNFRNTFFPVWDLIMDNTFGKISGPLGDAVKQAKDAMAEAKKKVDEGRQTAMRLQKIKDRATAQGLQAGSSGQNLTGYRDDWQSQLATQEAPPPPAVVPFFPLTGRKNQSSARKIELAEFNQVRGNHKYPGAANQP
jgi:hypothetical protein